MTKIHLRITAGLCAAVMLGIWAAPGRAQTSEVKEKPPMYTYFANWAIPRARWADMDKASVANRKVLDQAVSGGVLVGYGNEIGRAHV